MMNQTKMLRVMLITHMVLCFSALSGEQIEAESKKVNDYLDQHFDENVDRFPEWQTSLGIKKDYDKWDEDSNAVDERSLERAQQKLAWLRSEVNPVLLDRQTTISYRMAVDACQDEIATFKYRHYTYPVNQMFGRHTGVPSFLINMHRVDNADDAEAYISRLRGLDAVMTQLIEGLKKREKLGVVPPRFVFPRAIESCLNIVSGGPFDRSDTDSTLLSDFKSKIKKLDVNDARKEQWVDAVKNILIDVVEPAYAELVLFLEGQATRASDEAGIWKFKEGDAFYAEKLRLTTTTDLTADEIHTIGLREVKRIRKEMTLLKDDVGFKGSLSEFFKFTRTDERFYYPNTEEGRQAYLDRVTEVIHEMRGELDHLFLTQPKAKLEVKRVEAFREKSAGMAFYSMPAPDGSRPGIFYANLYDMKNMENYKLEALVYHEAIPGHHMQLALAQQMEELPKFRKYGGNTAYVEGWGLYSEFIPKEMGLYKDPYSDFGRLSMELFRACRLVVDTGIHAKRWTREEGIAYYLENTPDTERTCVRMVERHIVMPAQATAYKIGMLKILELREKAKHALGAQFDIREFHDVVLSSGAVPLMILEQLIDDYIVSKQSN